MTSASFSRPGAIDLSSLSGSAQGGPGSTGSGAGPGGAPVGPGGFVVDASEQTFQADIVDRSIEVPVVIDFWASWCEPCKQLSPILEKLAGEYAGRFVLAKIDIEANQRIAQAAQVQSIPLVVGVLKGQIVPLFQGALPEDQVRQYLDELLRVAGANGVSGTAQPVGGAPVEAEEETEPAADPRYAEADAALERGDLDGAIAAYEKLLDQTPGDAQAQAGMASAQLLRRTRDVSATQVRQEAADAPSDVRAQCAAADLDLVGGHVDDAFTRLVETVRRVSGADRDTARKHLLELFDVVGPEDPRVRKARQALASALF